MSISALATGKVLKVGEIRKSASDKKFCKFSLQMEDGFINCCAFGDDADEAYKIVKGAAIAVKGSLRLNEWQSPDGKNNHGLSMVISEMVVL